MKNSEILIKSLSEWANPIVIKAMQGSDNKALFYIQNLISPERLSNSLMNHLGLPFLKQTIENVPDELITPNFASDLIDGMIEKRVKEGVIKVPFIGVGLNPEAFRELKEICERNFGQYRENATN